MVREPTRGENILDLFLTTNHILVESVSITPGLSGHDIVKFTTNTKSTEVKKAPRKTLLYREADWASLKVYMQSFCHSYLSSCGCKSVEVMWTEFKEALDSGIQNSFPQNLWGTKNISHGSRNQLKEK